MAKTKPKNRTVFFRILFSQSRGKHRIIPTRAKMANPGVKTFILPITISDHIGRIKAADIPENAIPIGPIPITIANKEMAKQLKTTAVDNVIDDLRVKVNIEVNNAINAQVNNGAFKYNKRFGCLQRHPYLCDFQH